MKIQNQISVC